MQWKNKLHELDMVADELSQMQEKLKHIYIFGAGQIGFQIMHTLYQYGILAGFIDNDELKQHIGYRGYKVYSLSEYMEHRNGMLVVAVGKKTMPEILEQLADAQLLEGKDFYTYIEFSNKIFPIISLYLYNKSYISVAQISVTERCTLKCIKCAHGCWAVNNSRAKDLTLEQVQKSADSFFGKVDFTQEFVLIGGEPLLYKQLAEAIQYIGKRYRDQIGIFSITTNGTILPDERILKLCREYRVLFRISNYGATLPYLVNIYKRLTDVLGSHGIEYVLGKMESEWTDYGFDYVNRKASEVELIQVFDDCKTLCREIRENRFYFCVMARSVSENMGFHIGENDYLDMDSLEGEQGKKELLEFNLGYSEKGYLDMCNYCHGADSVKYPIPVAEQAKKGSNLKVDEERK